MVVGSPYILLVVLVLRVNLCQLFEIGHWIDLFLFLILMFLSLSFYDDFEPGTWTPIQCAIQRHRLVDACSICAHLVIELCLGFPFTTKVCPWMVWVWVWDKNLFTGCQWSASSDNVPWPHGNPPFLFLHHSLLNLARAHHMI